MKLEHQNKKAKMQSDDEEMPSSSSGNSINSVLTEQETNNCSQTLSKFIEKNKENFKENDLKLILKDLINAIEAKHLEKLAFENISPDNINAQLENKTIKLKLPETKKINSPNDYIEDIRNVGNLLISILDILCDNKVNFDKIKTICDSNKKINHIAENIKNPRWIKIENPRIFADLIIQFLDVECQNYKLIQSINYHAYLKEVNVTNECSNSQQKITLKEFIDKHEINENTFKYIVKMLLNELESKHSSKLCVHDITIDSISIRMEQDRAKPKLLDVKEDGNISTETKYLNKIKEVGKLLLSLFVQSEDLDVTIKMITESPDYNKKLECCFKKIMFPTWIQPNNKKLFADLIVCLINVKKANNPRAKEFKAHPYFWDEDRISKFIDKINSRLNMSTDGASKDDKREELVNQRKEVLEELMPKDYNWRHKLGNTISVFYPKENSWSELIKFIRNRDTHSDDFTDSETECKENNKKIEASPRQKTATKDHTALKQLSKFFSTYSGPLSFFLAHLDDLLYELFNHFRLYANHKIIQQFYCKSFLFEEPNNAYANAVVIVNKKHKSAEQSKPAKPDTPKPSKTIAKNQKPNDRSISKTNQPDMCNNNRNASIRKTSNREKKIEDATKKPIRCYLLF
ncbi:hypothetical protein ACKWTF_014668 [Chironomus riparius]